MEKESGMHNVTAEEWWLNRCKTIFGKTYVALKIALIQGDTLTVSRICGHIDGMMACLNQITENHGHAYDDKPPEFDCVIGTQIMEFYRLAEKEIHKAIEGAVSKKDFDAACNILMALCKMDKICKSTEKGANE